MKMNSVMAHSFSRVPQADIQRSKFNRSHGHKTTFNSGYLVPIYVDEALPGDTFSMNMTGFARLATPLHPIMDNMYMDTFFFAVPIRLVWENFQRFMGEQVDPGDSTDYLIPQIVSPDTTGWTAQSLFDYFGIPTEVPGLSHSTLWNRAYNLIWNEWFRDQNLQESLVVDRDDGPDTPADYVLKRRGKRHDYFTSCLPWPQKGPAVDIPLGTSAPITGIGLSSTGSIDPNVAYALETDGTGPVTYAAQRGTWFPNSFFVEEDPNNAGYPNIRADLTSATAATINQLRQAFQVQKMYERDARGGTRYTEIIKSHFGVTSPDARLQRPEYLGGGSTPVNIHPVTQTSGTDEATTPQGNLAAFGTATAQGHGFTKSFVEHCVIIGLVNVRADLNYQQGLNRMFSRLTKFDFYWPALAHLGEQTVLNKEIYAQGSVDLADDAAAFGYQERYAEYRYKPSIVTGQFRSNYSATLDSWHLAQEFESLPLLNASFIEDNPPISRTLAVVDEVQFIFDSFFSLTCARPMPTYSVPGLIDHF